MDCPMSIAVLQTRFRLAVERDDFRFGRFNDITFASVRSFIRHLAGARMDSKVPGQKLGYFKVDNDNVTMAQLLSGWISHPLGQTSIASLVFDRFCLEPVRYIARECMNDPNIRSDPRHLFAEWGVSNGPDWVNAIARTETAAKISAILFMDMVTALGHRTLRSFFLEPKRLNEFSIIGDGCRSRYGTPLKPLVASRESGTVTVTVFRYDEDVGTDAVTAYEWHASSRSDNQDGDEARACGMVYVFRRREGIPTGDRLDLILAADAVADVDVLQVQAFLEQTVDAKPLLCKSDLCFVWLWERRDNAVKGLGAECLRVALNLLQKRFKGVRTVVFNVKPLQFIDWGEPNELPSITLEKHSAVESIMTYIEKLNLRRLKVRFVSAVEVGDGQAAHLAIAAEFQRNS